MNKRRLSKQQQRRISENQQRLLNTSESGPGRDNCNGRVVSHHGKQLQVEPLQPADTGELVPCYQRANLPAMVTGDLVLFDQEEDGSGVILAQAERRNVFSRPDNHGNGRPVAANIDVVLVVFAVEPEPFMNLIDRYLVAIENLGLPATLLLNKVDLLDDAAHAATREDIDNIVSIYESLDYPVFTLSAHTGTGIDALEESLTGKTAVLVGQSGVGKSSLINRLGGTELSVVGKLSEARGKGTHTTTTARLFHLRRFDVIDSPGIREFSISHLEAAQVVTGFPELRELTGQCKFRDCSHQTEPGCAITLALEAGQIDPLRWQSYCQIIAGLRVQ